MIKISDTEYASKEELYFSWYLDELFEAGYIKSWKYEKTTFKLSENFSYFWEKKLKTKLKDMESTILRGHLYKPDFTVKFKNNLFFGCPYSKKDLKNTPFINMGDLCYIEIKPSFDQNNMTRLFKLNQKWVFDKYREYVNLVKLPEIFKKTFTPKRYLLTDKSAKLRKINFEVKTLDEYVEGI